MRSRRTRARSACGRPQVPALRPAERECMMSEMEPRLPATRETSSRRPSWVLLAFRLPREPSTPRIALWRRLKRLGVAQLLDGLVALPLDRRNREQLEWLANDVTEVGG